MHPIRVLRNLVAGRRAGLLRLRRADSPVRLECLREKCGLCCKVLGGTHVEPSEVAKLSKFNVLERAGEGARLACDSGKCRALTEGVCSVYEFRPRGCRDYPWYNIDGQLYYDAGCPGMKRGVDGRPDASLIRPVREYLPMGLERILIWVMKIW